ncbi:hypothetical protein GCM10010170_059810 [Dactylosporangium salmoneum]|uniref:OmpR/PhoB-type domain-containing protein n=1 Tax=Dactylosporangium salmoneum TaxID=53361 RepID=A0ABN3GWP2_9ACTN
MHINVLGDLIATRDGEPLDLGGRRQRALLALLVLARGETVSADRLVDAVWGEQPRPPPSRRCSPTSPTCADAWSRTAGRARAGR